jgi:hypothetical protein
MNLLRPEVGIFAPAHCMGTMQVSLIVRVYFLVKQMNATGSTTRLRF